MVDKFSALKNPGKKKQGKKEVDNRLAHLLNLP
jgi:hypothetical protein